MSKVEWVYTISWVVFSLVMTAYALLRRAELSITQRQYRIFLAQKWKLATFAAGIVSITAMGPFTHDPTWDFVTAPMMSIATFATAPWAVGTIYRVLRRREPLFHLVVAGCLWMLSVSWLYDLYLVLRDSIYPATWLANMAASSLLYVSAGLFWNLDWCAGRGVTFAFLEKEWLAAPNAQVFSHVFWFVLVFMGLGASMLLPYLESV